MNQIEVCTGVWLLEIPEHNLSILCGCPPDVVKLLMKRGLISKKDCSSWFCETGPNAILLSEFPMQGGKFANLIEFPILQMMYRQGMIIPGHPGNTGVKPVVIGLSPQLKAVAEYLFRGTYGLANREEILDCNIAPEFADEIIRIKLAFAFGNMRKSEDVLDMVAMDSGTTELRPGLFITRTGVNRYRFETGGCSREIDLNLKDGESYPSPLSLEYHSVRREYFSVIHLGEGNGWDTQKPCMSSIVVYQGKIYLIDTGPNILDSLTALGISVNEIEGIFHTHVHDDHFAGLTSLVRTDHKIKYYATSLVISSVMKKLTALMSVPEKRFYRSFEVHTLKHNEWNNINGLEVLPLYSPHPVEDNVLLFRTLWENGYKSYAHLADIACFSLLEEMLLKAENRTDVSEKLFRSFTSNVRQKTDLKKIDVDGGMIHGCAKDFAGDESGKIILAHIARDLTSEEKEIGTDACFGLEEVLIPARTEYVSQQAFAYLQAYFPLASREELSMLINCPVETMNHGSTLQKKDSPASHVYLIITGVAEMVHSGTGTVTMLSAGTLIGESAACSDAIPPFTYRARSNITVLKIPKSMYTVFITRNGFFDEVKKNASTSFFLQTTSLFGEMVSSIILHTIAVCLVHRKIAAGDFFDNNDEASLVLVEKGSFKLYIEDIEVDEIGVGGFFGEECVFFSGGSLILAQATEDSDCWLLKADLLRDIPIVEWKMLMEYERRLIEYGARRPRQSSESEKKMFQEP